jgi:hypothetical protein
MKNIASMTIVLISFSIVLSAQLSFQESTPVTLKIASDQPTLKHRVIKRQNSEESTPTPEDYIATCDALVNDVLCTVGIWQGLVEAALSCNGAYRSIEEAQKEANRCAKGESGQFCGSLLDLHAIRVRYIEGNCSRVLALNFCPSNCRSLLEDFRSTLGCCVTAYVNDTNRLSSGFYSASLNYRVWNLCNVPLPPAACENIPTINPPDNVQNCTDEDIFNKYYAENLCLPERLQPYIDAASICADTNPTTIKDSCSADTSGVPCGTLYYQSLKDLARLDSACSTSSVSCTSNCKDGIIAAKNRYGCCFESVWFNMSVTGIGTSLSPSYLSPSVLQSCDIDLPGTCEGIIGSAASIMKEKYFTLIVTGLMCLQLIMTV